jgi:hypothetical protein
LKVLQILGPGSGFEGGYLAKSTEAFVFAAQEQALRTRFIKAKIDGEEIDSMFRVCGKAIETVAHVASACGVLCQTEYKTRHDRMGLRIYWEVCRKYNAKCADKWYKEVPDKVRHSEHGNIEIW